MRGKNLQCPEKQGLHSRKSPENPVSLMMHRRKAGVGGVCTVYMDNGPVARSQVLRQVMGYLDRIGKFIFRLS